MYNGMMEEILYYKTRSLYVLNIAKFKMIKQKIAWSTVLLNIEGTGYYCVILTNFDLFCARYNISLRTLFAKLLTNVSWFITFVKLLTLTYRNVVRYM